MSANPKFKAIEESFEGHEAGAVDGISRDIHVAEPPDEPTKEHHIQLAGDFPEEGAAAPELALDEAPAKPARAIPFPKAKKGSGGGMKNLLAKLTGNKPMLLGVGFGAVLFGVIGFLAYQLNAVQGKMAKLERSSERARFDQQRSDDGGAAAQAAQVNQYLSDVNQKLTILDRRLAQLENAPPRAAAAAPVAAAPKVATAKAKKAAGADRKPASVKKAKATKKRR